MSRTKSLEEIIAGAVSSFDAVADERAPTPITSSASWTPSRTRAASLDELGWPARAISEAATADTAKSAIVRLAGWDPNERSACILSGPPGTGKTVGAAHWCLARSERIRFVRASTFAASSRYNAEQRSLWYESAGLCLDDLGAEYLDAKGSFLVDLDELVDTYYADQRPLLITTNLDAKGFKARYGSRVEDRIRECALWITVAGDSMRRAP